MAAWAETEVDTDTGGNVGRGGVIEIFGPGYGGGVIEVPFGPGYGGGEGDDAVVPDDDFRRILIPFDPIRMQEDSSCLYR